MSNGQDEHDVVSGQPAVLRDVTEATARQYKLVATIFSQAAQERMVCQQLERATDAEYLLARTLWIVNCNKFEQPLQIRESPLCYFDARHECARGRLVVVPAARACK